MTRGVKDAVAVPLVATVQQSFCAHDEPVNRRGIVVAGREMFTW